MARYRRIRYDLSRRDARRWRTHPEGRAEVIARVLWIATSERSCVEIHVGPTVLAVVGEAYDPPRYEVREQEPCGHQHRTLEAAARCARGRPVCRRRGEPLTPDEQSRLDRPRKPTRKRALAGT